MVIEFQEQDISVFDEVEEAIKKLFIKEITVAFEEMKETAFRTGWTVRKGGCRKR